MADRFGYGEIGLDINPCRGCEDYDAPDGCKSNGGCGKPITNADRIRSMTDEELEAWLVNLCCATVGDAANARVQILRGNLLEWLRQEYKE